MAKGKSVDYRTHTKGKGRGKKFPVGLPPGEKAYSKLSYTCSPSMLRVLGESLYSRRAEAAIREPIQNALDSGTEEVIVEAEMLPDHSGRMLFKIGWG